MTNIILCGGSGTRLWPLSRTLMPKQFVKLFEGESLFQKTVSRNQKACDSQFIVSNAEQYFLAVGGRVLKNETIKSAIYRICNMEIGIIPAENPGFIGVFEHFYNDSIFNNV